MAERETYIDKWLKGGRCDIGGINKHRLFLTQILCTFQKSWVIRLVKGRFRDMRPFVYNTFRKTKLGQIIKKTCLIFREQDKSPKSNLRMFKLDNKEIFEKNTCNGNHAGA